jgi:hypothetical protein
MPQRPMGQGQCRVRSRFGDKGFHEAKSIVEQSRTPVANLATAAAAARW